MVGFVEGKAPLDPPIEGGKLDRRGRVNESAEVGIGGVQMSRHAGNEKRTRVVLACGYRGIIGNGIGIKEKGFADRYGFGDIGTAGSSLFGTTHAGMIAAHVNSKTKEEEEEKNNVLYDISAMGGVKLNIILFTIYILRCKGTAFLRYMQESLLFNSKITLFLQEPMDGSAVELIEIERCLDGEAEDESSSVF